MTTATSSSSLLLQHRRTSDFVPLSIVMLVIVIVGFWPSYYGPLLIQGNALRPWVIHLHGGVFVGWMALLLAQVALAATGRVRAHRKLGAVGIGYGCLVLVMGLIVSVAAPVLHVRAGEWNMDRAAGFLPIPLGDMALFGGFFAAAVFYRRKPELHKRLMLLATVALIFAAAARMVPFIPVPAALFVWLSPLLIGIGFDVFRRRRVHPVYVIGLAIFLAALLRFPLGQSAGWLRIGRAVIRSLV